MKYRTERDTMGEVSVPVRSAVRAQTQRAVDNFTIAARTMPPLFIRCLARIKSRRRLPTPPAADCRRISPMRWCWSPPG